MVTGLATLQSAIQDLSRAYIAHTNTVLLSGTTNPQDLLVLSNPLGQHGFAASRSLLHPGPAVGPGRLRKKAKRVHDPNAPKRPLTPYFLFMQHARHIIAEDLGGKASPGAVSTEGTRRWLAMPDDQKEVRSLSIALVQIVVKLGRVEKRLTTEYVELEADLSPKPGGIS